MDKELKRLIILDNYQNPYNKKDIEDPTYIKINTNNESCIDDLNIYFKVEDNKIIDVGFNGEACTISTSATSIMLKNLIGKSLEEVKELITNYSNMINEKEYDKELYDEIYLEPNRKNCALLPVKALERLLKELENAN